MIITAGMTEADLEARITAVLRKLFYWLPADSIRHQTRLRLQLGHTLVTLNGAERESIDGRIDVFVTLNNTPLCVLELKKPGLALDDDDVRQGRSYAITMDPRPPLVVVTNGTDTRFVVTQTGADWTPQTPSENELQKLLATAASVAEADFKQALSILMAPDKTVWSSALREASKSTLAQQTGNWGDEHLPYARDFLIPREATDIALQWLQTHGRVLILSGTPLSGKSNVVRDLAERSQDSGDHVVFVLEADAVATQGAIRALTNILARAFGWPISSDEARDWLRKLSRGAGTSLVLVLDGLAANSDTLRGDIDELSDDVYGPKLRLVLVMDDTTVESFVTKSGGRNASPIGRRSRHITVDALSDREFERAQAALLNHRIGFTAGAQYAAEYRAPWLLRTMAASTILLPRYKDETVQAALPPMLSLELIGRARDRFGNDEELGRLFGQIAQALLDDRRSDKPSVELMLRAMNILVVRRSTLLRHLSETELNGLVSRGLLRRARTAAREAVLIPRLGELLASELAAAVGQELEHELSKRSPTEAADWLIATTATLPMGDIIGAQAILDASQALGGMPLGLVSKLLSAKPRQEAVKPGRYAMIPIPDAGVLDLIVKEDGVVVMRHDGEETVLEDGEPLNFYADFESWLLLSHFAGIPAEVHTEAGSARLDPALLMEVGSSPIVLRRPGSDPRFNSVLSHAIPGQGDIACHKRGIVEPITFSILKFLSHEGERAEDWMDEALERNSLPLIGRIDIALRQLGSSANLAAGWARAVLAHKIGPAVQAFPELSH
jgi:dsDNA-binding SOS-regulon protein